MTPGETTICGNCLNRICFGENKCSCESDIKQDAEELSISEDEVLKNCPYFDFLDEGWIG